MSLLLLMGVAGCTAGPIEEPRLPAGSAQSLGAEGGEAEVARFVRMAKRSLATGDPRTALGLLEQALVLDPNDREAALTLGYAHLAAGTPQDAGEAFGRILQRLPADREAGIGYARAMIGIGRSEAALEHLEPLVRRRADDVEAMNLAAIAFDLEGEHAKAAELYRRALAADPKAGDVSSNLGLSLALDGRHEEALAILEPLAKGYASSPRHRQNLALAFGLAGRFDEAERWSRMDLSDADVANNLSFFRLVRGLAPGAVRSAALQPDLSEPVVMPAPAPARLVEAPSVSHSAAQSAASKSTAAATPPTLAEMVPVPAETSVATAGAASGPDSPPHRTADPAAPRSELASSAEPAAIAAPRDLARAMSPGERLPPALRPRAGFVVGDVAVTGVGVEVASLGSWFVDLGTLPEPAWREVKDRHGELTAGLYRLASGSGEKAPLVVGPFATAADADELCRVVDDAAPSCRPVRL